MSKRIMVATLGGSWTIIPETVGVFLYNKSQDFYKANDSFKRKEFLGENFGGGKALDEVWLVSTDQKAVGRCPSLKEMLQKINRWTELYKPAEKLKIKVWVLKGVQDVSTADEVRLFKDLIFRVMARAHRECNCNENAIAVSLAGGRKTMSADMQEAANCFGCGLMMHVVGDPFILEDKSGNVLSGFSNEQAKKIFPIKMGNCPRNELMDNILKGVDCINFETACEQEILFENVTVYRWMPRTNCVFLTEVEKRQKEAQHFYSSSEEDDCKYANFSSLYTLRKTDREKLKKHRIGCDPKKEKRELKWLKAMPKADLHCHLGGCLRVDDLIDVAETLKEKLSELSENNKVFKEWRCDPPKIGESWKEWKARISYECGVDTRFIAPRFICEYGAIKDGANRLGKQIYGDEYPNMDLSFVSIAARKKNDDGSVELNLAPYERLGDLQGSSLLCHKETLKKCVQILMETARTQNVKYLEVRCSPINYESEDFSRVDVVKTICDTLGEYEDVKSSVIFIASRHSDEKKILAGIDLYKELRNHDWFMKYFRGFDLAGNEASKDASKMAEYFQDIKKDCLNITIHAGETMPVDSVWQAVYCLNAERIGHGLTLRNSEELKEKFRQRGIGVEMCPSSNYQIVGFDDNYYENIPRIVKLDAEERRYPLLDYLSYGLRVCVNTDDPGISNTDMTHELLKAARLTKDGLSLWEIFALLYNSFDLAFLPYEEKRKLQRDMDKEVRNWVKEYIGEI